MQQTKDGKKTGRIKEIRESDDRQDVSFVITLANGRETIRHRSHLRHNITRYTRVTDRRVTFNLKGDTEGEDKDKRKTELKKRGRLSKLDKTESTNDCETVSDSMNDSEMSISKKKHLAKLSQI